MSMLLALDTSTRHCSVALWRDGDCFMHEADTPQSHARSILPMVQAVLAEAQVSPGQLDALAFAHGPGAFTGLRIAAATAQGLALGWNRPVIAVSTLEVLARQAVDMGEKGPFMAVLDARMGELYAAVFCEPAKMGEAPSLITQERVLEWVSGHGVQTVVGQPGEHAGLFEACRLVEVPPRADALAALAGERLHEARPVSEVVPVPLYLRDKVADKPAGR